MKHKEKFGSIFDAASKLNSSNKASQQITSKESARRLFPYLPKGPVKDDTRSVEDRFADCKKYYEEIRVYLEQTFKQNNLTEKTVHDYLEAPENFSSGEWNALEQVKKQLDRELNECLATQIELSDSESDQTEQREKKNKLERKKNRLLKKSRWMPMQ